MVWISVTDVAVAPAILDAFAILKRLEPGSHTVCRNGRAGIVFSQRQGAMLASESDRAEARRILDAEIDRQVIRVITDCAAQLAAVARAMANPETREIDRSTRATAIG